MIVQRQQIIPRHSLRIVVLLLTSHIVINYCYDIDEQMGELDDHAFVSKVDENLKSSKVGVTTDIDAWSCDCYNPSTDEINAVEELECKCYGKKLTKIPKNLGGNLSRLTIMDSEMEIIRNHSLRSYNESLTDV